MCSRSKQGTVKHKSISKTHGFKQASQLFVTSEHFTLEQCMPWRRVLPPQTVAHSAANKENEHS